MAARIRHPVQWLVVLLLLIGIVLVLNAQYGPTSAEIRLDTGDLRYFTWGIPVWLSRQHEPQRSELLGIAAQSKVLQPQWHQCRMQVGSNNEDLMLAGFYGRTADWIAVDPKVALILTEDLADGIQHGGDRGWACIYFFRFIRMDANGDRSIDPAWRRDPQVLYFLKSKGYTPAATQPSAR
jgi:hypothetical protein